MKLSNSVRLRIAVAIAAITLVGGVISSHAQVVISVPAGQPHTDTGIAVSAGQVVSVAASGTIYIGEQSNPLLGWTMKRQMASHGGGPACPSGSLPFTAPGLPCWSLSGRIGNGAPFEIGSYASFTAGAAGEFYLGVNDSYYPDNSGAWTATITVRSGPTVSFLGTIPNRPRPRIAIEGQGFGTLPPSYGLSPTKPFSGDSPYFRFRDLTQGWDAGYQASGSLIGDACTVTIYDWEPTKLAVEVNAGVPLLCPAPAIGDVVEVDICNPESSSPCTPDSSSPDAARESKTVTGQVTLRLFIPPGLNAQQIGGLSVGFMPGNVNQMTEGIVAGLAAQAITIDPKDVGYAMVDQRTVPQDAVTELTFLISAPNFFSDLVGTALEAPELLPIPVIEQFGIPSPPEIVAQEIAPVADAEAQLRVVTAQWCNDVPSINRVPEFLIAREIGTNQELQITVSNLSQLPTEISIPVSYYVIGTGVCTRETSGYLEVKVSPPVQGPDGPVHASLTPGSN